jgi:hypothetical protein
MTPRNRKFFTAVIMAAALAFIAAVCGVTLFHHGRAGSLFINKTDRRTQENNYEYDLAAVSAVDSSLVGYREKRVIPVPVADPCGICVDNRDRIYAAGTGGIFMLDSAGGIAGNYPSDEWMRFCAVDESGRVYAGSSRALRRYGRNGTLEKSWNAGSDSSVLTSVALDDDNVYIGTRDSARNIPGFILPSPHLEIAVGQDGSLWAVNAGRHTIDNFRPNGDLITSWGAAGTGIKEFCGCCNPIRMALLPNGSFVTSEKGIVRVKIYNQAGEFVCVAAPPSTFRTIGEGLDLAVDSQGNILVLVAQEKTIRIYEKKQS